MTPAFDTLKFVKHLREAGISESKAERLAYAFRKAQGEADLATKRDLKELELKLTGELTLLKWMMGLVLGGVVALVLKAFFPL